MSFGKPHEGGNHMSSPAEQKTEKVDNATRYFTAMIIGLIAGIAVTGIIAALRLNHHRNVNSQLTAELESANARLTQLEQLAAAEDLRNNAELFEPGLLEWEDKLGSKHLFYCDQINIDGTYSTTDEIQIYIDNPKAKHKLEYINIGTYAENRDKTFYNQYEVSGLTEPRPRIKEVRLYESNNIVYIITHYYAMIPDDLKLESEINDYIADYQSLEISIDDIKMPLPTTESKRVSASYNDDTTLKPTPVENNCNCCDECQCDTCGCQ